MAVAPKVTVICFATRGEPHDAGLPIAHMIPLYERACIERGKVDAFYGYTPDTLPSDLSPEDSEACSRVYGKEHAIGCRSYHLSGLGAWRGILLDYHVKRAEDGDFVCFHDPNYEKYPSVMSFANDAKRIVLNMAKFIQSDVFASLTPIPVSSTVSKNGVEAIRAHVIEHFPEEPLVEEDMTRVKYMRARMVVVKVNPDTRKFCEILRSISRDVGCLSPPKLPRGGWPEGVHFDHHAGDQALFNALFYMLKRTSTRFPPNRTIGFLDSPNDYRRFI